MRQGISIGGALLWTALWFGFMLLYTLLHTVLWKKLPAALGGGLHLLTIGLCGLGYLALLRAKTGFQPRLLEGISWKTVLLALACAGLLYLLLDKGLDPLLERRFPVSEQEYQQALLSLSQRPVSGLIQVCVLAPLMEEIIMRAFLLNGLTDRYGWAVGLAVSALLFAALHFNMVQTLSALVCGLALGVLYLRTQSLFCCVLAHSGYNLLSYWTTIFPLIK